MSLSNSQKKSRVYISVKIWLCLEQGGQSNILQVYLQSCPNVRQPFQVSFHTSTYTRYICFPRWPRMRPLSAHHIWMLRKLKFSVVYTHCHMFWVGVASNTVCSASEGVCSPCVKQVDFNRWPQLVSFTNKMDSLLVRRQKKMLFPWLKFPSVRKTVPRKRSFMAGIARSQLAL